MAAIVSVEFSLSFEKFNKAQTMIKFSKLMIETNLEVRKVYSYTANLLMLNEGLIEPSSLPVSNYGSLLVNSLFTSVDTISVMTSNIETAVKSESLVSLLTISGDNRLNLKLGEVSKSFTLQESLNLISSNILSLGKVPAAYLSTDSGVLFILANAEVISERLAAVSIEIEAYFKTLKNDVVALILTLAAVGLSVLFFAASVGFTALSLRVIRKELALSLGFELEDCVALRNRLDQIRKQVNLASERLNQQNGVSMSTFDDMAEKIQSQNAKSNLTKRRRKYKGSIYSKIWGYVIRSLLVFTLVSLIVVGLIDLFSTASVLLLNHHQGFITVSDVSITLSKQLSAVKSYTLSKYLNIKGKDTSPLLQASLRESRYAGNTIINIQTAI